MPDSVACSYKTSLISCQARFRLQGNGKILLNCPSQDRGTHPLFVDQNPCVDYSLLGTIARGCISKHAQALTAETTTEGKCRYVQKVILLS
jgi:hypothetical protein